MIDDFNEFVDNLESEHNKKYPKHIDPLIVKLGELRATLNCLWYDPVEMSLVKFKHYDEIPCDMLMGVKLKIQ